MDNTDINNSSRVYALFYSFFLIPLMITIFGFLFFFLFKILTYEKQDPYHLLNNINSGSQTKRWQSAYELSNLMSDESKIPTDQLFISQMISMYEKSIHDDPRVRTYLALAMGQTRNSLFCDILKVGFNDENLENRIAVIKSIGMIGCIDCISSLNAIVDSKKDNQERLAAIISIGMFADSNSVDVLTRALGDDEANIRWDSAISLLKMDNYSGIETVKKLLQRHYYENFPEVDVNEIDRAMLTVMALIDKDNSVFFENELNILADLDKNIKIREFAIRIIKEYY